MSGLINFNHCTCVPVSHTYILKFLFWDNIKFKNTNKLDKKKYLYCRGIRCSVSRLNQSNAQISLAFRHHWPELQWCNRHRRLSSLVVQKLSEFRYPSLLLEFRVISSCLKYSIIKTFLFSHTAFFIIPIPALRTDMDSGELISIYRTDTDNLLESPYSVLIFNLIRIYECPIWRRYTVIVFCNRCSLKKTNCWQICS